MRPSGLPKTPDTKPLRSPGGGGTRRLLGPAQAQPFDGTPRGLVGLDGGTLLFNPGCVPRPRLVNPLQGAMLPTLRYRPPPSGETMSSKRYPRRTFTECTSRFRSRLTLCLKIPRDHRIHVVHRSAGDRPGIVPESWGKGARLPGRPRTGSQASGVSSKTFGPAFRTASSSPALKARGRLSDLVQKEDGDIALQPALGISAAEARGSPRLGRGPRDRKGLRKQTVPNITVKPLTQDFFSLPSANTIPDLAEFVNPVLPFRGPLVPANAKQRRG